MTATNRVTVNQAQDRAGGETAGGNRQGPGGLATVLVHSVHTHPRGYEVSHVRRGSKVVIGRLAVDASIPLRTGYEVVGISQGRKVWTDGEVEFRDGIKRDWQGGQYDYSAMVMGFR